MNRDGRDSDDADWLLAQLATGASQADQETPVATPPVSASSTSARSEAAVSPPSEEVLDWFTMAESPAPQASPVASAPQTSSPEWRPPFTVGRPPAPAAPTGPAAAGHPPTPAAPVVPPGPATPPAPFAFTWGSDELDSEDAIRAAFRSLSGGQSTNDDGPATADRPGGVGASTDASRSAHEASTDTGPALARQSFTPFSDASPVIPRHPIAPTTAPAGWDERPTSTPKTDFDDELWSALTEDEPAVPAVIDAPVSPTVTDAPVSPPLTDAPVSPPATAGEATPSSSLPADYERDHDSFPFIEVRGEAGPRSSEISEATTAASIAESAKRRAPFPAFAAARGDDPFGQPDDRGAEPVDDLLAALGSGAARPTGDGSGTGTSVPGDRESGFGTPPAGGAPPSGSGDDPFGWGSDDDGSDDDFSGDDRDDDDAGDGLGALGLEFAEDDDEPARTAETESPIAREIGETRYFWNLTPDPTAPDPKADPSVAAGATTVPSPFAPPSPFAADGDDESTRFEPEPETGPVVPEPAWPREPAAAEPPATTEVEPPADTTMFAPPAPSMFERPDASAVERPETSAFEPPAPYTFQPPPTDFDQAPPSAVQPVAYDTTDTPHVDPLAALFGATAEPGAPTTPRAPSAPRGAPFSANAASAGAGAGAGAVGGSTPVARATAPAASAPTAAPRVGGTGGSGRAPSAGSGGGGRPGGGRTTRTLLWIAAGLVVCLVLAGLFYVGTLLSAAGGGEAAAPSAAPVETETPVAEPTAPQPAGVHAWNTLFGGECVEPFVSVWEEEFTVVDCAAPHAAQLVYRGELAGDAAAAYPGEAEVAAQATAMCTADGVIDVGLVAGIPDLQVQAAFPADEQQWADGERTVYCFANRTGAEPLTGSIAGPGPTA